MKSYIKLATLALVASVLTANAAQVGISSSGTVTNLPNAGNQFTIAQANSSTFVPNGALIQIGYFTNGTLTAGTSITPGQIATLQSSFVQFGNDKFLNVAVPGKLTNVIEIATFGPTRPTNQLAVWIWNTGNEGTATQVGIFTATNWVFPVNDAGAGSAVSLVFLTNFVSANSLVALAGSFDLPGVYTLPNSRSANLAVIVPEPTTAVALLGVGLMSLRRRRKA